MNTDVQTSEPIGAATSQKSQVFALFLVVFISLLGFGIVLPVFPFFGTMVGATPAQITLAMAAYSLGQFIGAPVWGQLSDKYGRRPILLASLAASAAAYILMAHATDIWTLGVSRLIGGLMAGNIAAAFAYVGDVTDDTTRPRAISYHPVITSNNKSSS
ncbi:MAG: MFS transporter [Pseudomonadota bacterium]